MNIFCTYNTLWGLARMHAREEMLGPVLFMNLFNKVVEILHTFLPTQYGDIVWSLGSLGNSVTIKYTSFSSSFLLFLFMKTYLRYTPCVIKPRLQYWTYWRYSIVSHTGCHKPNISKATCASCCIHIMGSEQDGSKMEWYGSASEIYRRRCDNFTRHNLSFLTHDKIIVIVIVIIFVIININNNIINLLQRSFSFMIFVSVSSYKSFTVTLCIAQEEKLLRWQTVSTSTSDRGLPPSESMNTLYYSIL